MREFATYQEIQNWMQQEFGFKPKICWIARCKEIYGLPLVAGLNRQGVEPVELCPPDKRPATKKALEHFGMLA
jgi:hypothetical protein